MKANSSDTGDMYARILDTAEALLRRFGPEKLTVTDVARAMDMSHGNVYRHIPSKAALRAAVIARWLEKVSNLTDAIAQKAGPADQRLREWLVELAVIKQRKVTEDAEMLAGAALVVRESPDVEQEHSARLRIQVIKILQDGLKDGTLPHAGDVGVSASAILNATFRYHHPDLVAKGGAPEKQLAALQDVVSLILAGLQRLPE